MNLQEISDEELDRMLADEQAKTADSHEVHTLLHEYFRRRDPSKRKLKHNQAVERIGRQLRQLEERVRRLERETHDNQ